MAKGASSKEMITSRLLDLFPDAFINGKEIRIPWMENGELLQIKCTLTCAKDMVDPPNGFPEPAEKEVSTTSQSSEILTPTEEEKAKVNTLLEQLGIKE